MTLNQLKTRAKALDLMIRKDGKGGYLADRFPLTDADAAPGPMTLEEVEMWLDDLDEVTSSKKAPLRHAFHNLTQGSQNPPPKGRLMKQYSTRTARQSRKDGIT